jgi:hypothetical protein
LGIDFANIAKSSFLKLPKRTTRVGVKKLPRHDNLVLLQNRLETTIGSRPEGNFG